jgi:very-short-patch-repair endonuclease
MEVAGEQRGLIALNQAIALGLTYRVITKVVGSGHWRWHRRNVLRVGPLVDDPRREPMAAVLAAGPRAVLSHRWAAWMLGLLERRPPEPIEVTVHGTSRPRLAGIRVFRARTGRRLVVDGIPCTPPLRTLVNLAAVAGEDELWRALDQAVVLGLVSREALERLVARPLRGYRGSATLRRLVQTRVLGNESELERRMEGVLDGARPALPPFECQVIVLLPEGEFRLDFAWQGVKVALEVDGEGTRAGARVRTRDLRRQRALERAGWIVIRATWADLDDPRELLAILRAAIATRSLDAAA